MLDGSEIKPLDMQELGNRIRSRRAYMRMTQSALAESIGMERTTIWAIESARQSLTLETAYKIAQVLNFSGLDDLIGGGHE